MLWRLDHEEAVNTAGITDEGVKKLLELAFSNLKLIKVKEASLNPTLACFA